MVTASASRVTSAVPEAHPAMLIAVGVVLNCGADTSLLDPEAVNVNAAALVGHTTPTPAVPVPETALLFCGNLLARLSVLNSQLVKRSSFCCKQFEC